MFGKKMKRVFAVLLATCTLFTQGNVLAFAAESTSENTNGVPEGIVSNYQEAAPVDSSFAGTKTGTSAVYGSLPASYSASADVPMDVEVKEDHVTSVKNQSPYGTCWAHSAISIAESSYIINENVSPDSIDYNEYHLVHYGFGAAADSINLFGGDYNSYAGSSNILEQGGNNLVSLCMFASWHGASGISQSIYGADHILNGQTPESIVGYDDAAHMENGYVLTMPDMSSTNYLADMNVVKQMIMEYGSVAISYWAEHNPDYFQGAYQYCYDEHETNHSVTVVGWDDTVSASKFKTAPPGDGAWIVKNSWGSDWSAGGYFYLSYYDATIFENAFAFDFVSADNYDNNYQYDGSGNFHGTVGGNYGQITAANAFVADSNETLEAVGFYTRSINNEYEIRIYRGLAEGANPTTGTLVWTQTGLETYVGYHTVELNTDISIAKGERYAVVITLKGDADEYMLFPADTTDGWGWVEFISLAKAGESYVGTDVSTLTDLNSNNTDDHYRGRNVRIKAFTNERSSSEDVKVTSVTLDHATYELEKGENVTLNAVVTPANATNVKVIWSSSNANVATVDQYGNVAAVGAGTAIITATAQDGSVASASCTITVTEVLAEDIAIVADGEVVSYYRIDTAGSTQRFYAAFSPADTTNTDVIWTSSNPAVATIDENGGLRAISRGMTIITATTKDGSNLSASCLVAVQTVFVDSMKLVLDGQETDYFPNAEIGQVYDFDLEITPAETAMLGVTWSSSNPSIATVDQNGVVKILSEGNAVIDASVTVDGFTYKAECYIEVVSTGVRFAVQHYVMNTKGAYELAEAEYITSVPNNIFTYQNLVKANYNDGQTLNFVSMMQNGSPINMYYAQDGDIVQMYYERLMTPVYVAIELDDSYSEYASSQAYYVGAQVSIDTEWIKNMASDLFDRTGEMEVNSVVVEQGNVDVVLNNGTYSFITPVNTGMVIIKFKVYEKINFEVDHYVMNESGSYVLAKVEHLSGYAKDSYPCRNLVKAEYNTGSTYFKTLTVNDQAIAGLDINTSIRLAEDDIVKIYYDRKGSLEGWNQAADGNWYYYKDGKVDTTLNGLAANEEKGEWWYAVNGKADFTYTGLTLYNGTWYYVENGVLNWNYTGLTLYYGTWYYVEGGILNWGYTGLTLYYGNWYYVEGGVLNWGYTGLCEYYGNWYYVEGGVLNWGYTGLTLYNGTWYYVENGVLNWGYTGLTLYYGTWYYVEGGVLNWGFTGLVNHYGTWYYVGNGILDWSFTGTVYQYGTWWYVENGVLVGAA